MFPAELQYLISNYLIFGFLPLDKVLHVVAGAVLTILLRLFGLKLGKIFLIIGVIAAAKEYHDSFVLNNSPLEHLVDFLVTFLYPALLGVVQKVKADEGHSKYGA